jgi:hypothetical protein
MISRISCSSDQENDIVKNNWDPGNYPPENEKKNFY